MCVFEAPGEPGVYVAVLELDRLRTHRSNDIMGDKYRHPPKYGSPMTLDYGIQYFYVADPEGNLLEIESMN